MSGKPNDKWLETMIKKHGSREAVRARQKEIGRKGGLVKGTQGGFASPKLCTCEIFDYQAHTHNRCAGSIGGRRSRRTKKPLDSSTSRRSK